MSDSIKKMYDEELVKEIMISAALCVREMLLDDPNAKQDDVFDFVDNNFRQIIEETLLAESERQESESRDDAADALG